MKYKIKQTKLSDNIKSIFNNCFPDKDFDLNVANVNNPVYVALVDDQPVGFCMLNDVDLGNGVAPCVYNLMVLPKYRLYGIASALLQAVPYKAYMMVERESKLTKDWVNTGYKVGHTVLCRGFDQIKKLDGIPDGPHYDAKQNLIYL